MYCEKCGTMQNGGEKFCPNCGTPFTEGVAVDTNVYCSKCGTEQNGEEKFCPNCGTPFTEVVKIVNKESASPKDEKKGRLVLLRVAAAIAVLCAIFYFVTKDDKSDNPTNHYESETPKSIENNNTNKSQSSRIEVTFYSEIDVRTFLCNYKFSDGKLTLTFSSGGNEMEANGRLRTTYMEIKSLSFHQAELYFHSPYGNLRLMLFAEDGEAALMDMNDLSVYYASKKITF